MSVIIYLLLFGANTSYYWTLLFAILSGFLVFIVGNTVNYVFPNLSIASLQWSLMTLLEPAKSVEHLIYIGFPGDPSSAIRLTRRRRLDRKKQQCERKVFQCFVFGPNNAGKSALLNCFLGRFVLLARNENLLHFQNTNRKRV